MATLSHSGHYISSYSCDSVSETSYLPGYYYSWGKWRNEYAQKEKWFDSLPEETHPPKAAFMKCRNEDIPPIIIIFSKFFAVDVKALPQNEPWSLTQDDISQRHEDMRHRYMEKLAGVQGQETLESTWNGNALETSPKREEWRGDKQQMVIMIPKPVSQERKNLVCFVVICDLKRKEKKENPSTVPLNFWNRYH